MCHHDQMVRPKGELPLPLFERCADQVAEIAPATDVWFSFCGEPLMVPDLLFDAVAYGASVGLTSLNLNTNGARLGPKIAERIVQSELSTVVIGIDGFSAPVYESIRCGAKRDEVYANVEYLLYQRRRAGRGPEIMVQFIEMDANRHEREAFSAHWSALGATLKIRRQLSWGARVPTTLCPPVDRIPCPWAMTMMHLFWDGRVPRCPGDTEGDESVGNAWQEPLVDLWARLGDYRSLHMARDFEALPERCQSCTDWMVGASQKVRPEGETSDT